VLAHAPVVAPGVGAITETTIVVQRAKSSHAVVLADADRGATVADDADNRRGGSSAGANPWLVGRRLLNVVDHENVHWPFGRFQLEPQLLLGGP
jgi:hypothetical protein